MSKKRELDRLLSRLNMDACPDALDRAMNYARAIADIEGNVAVVSDLAQGTSRIIAGSFARQLGLGDYSRENSIWEEKILSLMSAAEQEEKYIAELRFYHYLRHIPREKRPDYYLISKLRFTFPDGDLRDVMHKMYYLYAPDGESVQYAICLYGPLIFDMPCKSCVANSLTGVFEELTTNANDAILSRRERQILLLIESGLSSREIAERLCISVHTVSRHRQEILSKLQVKNSHEACRLAKSMGLFQK